MFWGWVIFDILNGYLHSIPNVFVSTIIKCLFVGAVFALMKRKADGDRKKEYAAAVICSAVYGVTNIIVDFIWSTGELVLMGSTVGAALAGGDHLDSCNHYQCRLYGDRHLAAVFPCDLRLQTNRPEIIIRRRLMINIPKIQTLLHDYRLDGWLFTDFHGHDFITRDFLQLTDRTCTRRLFYYIPARGNRSRFFLPLNRCS